MLSVVRANVVPKRVPADMTSALTIQAPPGRRIGLLGGSFNPAHEGHIHISELALKVLKLDEIWWLVTPQNPLKPEHGMGALEDRLASAGKLATGHAITATDIEVQLGTRYTADTLAALKQKFEGVNFVWLMGADNLIQVDQWARWPEIFETVPVAVFARPEYSEAAENAKASRNLHKYRLESNRAEELAGMNPPAWIFLKTPENPTSATEIRARGNSPEAE
jgi:nicotinate-nucleotide adenylyltransferase